MLPLPGRQMPKQMKHGGSHEGMSRRRSMSGRFYGWENADLPFREPDSDFPGIRTVGELYEALSGSWCAETCAPRMRAGWNPGNRTLGQCSVTAFLAQDLFGGSVFGVPLGDGNYHCYNQIQDHVFDLTCEQFEGKEFRYDCSHEQQREIHFAKEEKRKRYELLRQRLMEYCTGF